MSEDLKQKIAKYKVPARARELIKKTKIVFMVGVSAAGKDTVRTKLLLSGKYHHIISHTTRKPRANHGIMELEGTDYHFINLAKAEEMLDEKKFVEAKIFSGNIYGTSLAEIQKAHDESKIAITDLEVQGVAEYKKIAESVIPIFLLPPDYETWQKRLSGRYEDGQIDGKDIKRRMATAKIELQEALDKPYFEYVVNHDFETTIKIVDEIAHGEFSQKKNEQARLVAEELMKKINP
jgi:guanylate kinase